MVSRIHEYVRAVRWGDPIEHERLSIVPLTMERASELEYLVLEEALERRLVDIGECTEGGSVPRMVVHNRALLPVFIPDGTALVGSRQNRVVNMSVLLAAQTDTVIPVSCIEQGRWSHSYGPSSSRGYSDKELRHRMCHDINWSARMGRGVSVSQSGVWCHVQEILREAEAASPTDAYHAVFEKSEGALAEYETSLPYPEGACGAAVLVDGKVSSVDLFDKPETCRKLWPNIVRGHAVGCLYGKGSWGSEEELTSFLAEAAKADEHALGSIGIGTSVRLTAKGEVGAALFYEDTVIHLSLFAQGQLTEPRMVRWPAPGTGRDPSRRRRPPRWKFWTRR